MLKPSRREILSALSVGGGTFLAGCAVGSDESNETTSTADGNTSSTGSTSTADGDNSSTESTQSPPEFPENTSSDACPPFDDADRVVCYDAVDHERMPLVLVPERQMLQPDQPTAFTLRNQSRQQFQTNFYHWQLYKHVDGDWYYILPQSWPVPMTPLGAGENHTWTLTVTTGRVSDGMDSDTAHGTGSLTIAGLGGGDYAFGTDGRFATGSYEGPVALAAGFELTTDPLQLTPTTAITETKQDGETLVARSTRSEAIDDTDQRDIYILERIDEAEPDTRQVIIEQVVRNDQLRDAIALSQKHNASRIRLEEFSRSFPPFGIDDAQTYEFRGDYYRVTTEDGSS
jgi:hypothetical protein